MRVAEARQVLTVLEGASLKDITSQYRKLAKKHHPDKPGASRFAPRRERVSELLLMYSARACAVLRSSHASDSSALSALHKCGLVFFALSMSRSCEARSLDL